MTVRSDDEAAHLNGSELQPERLKDKHRSLSKEAGDKTVARSVGRESDLVEKVASRNRVRPGDGDVMAADRVWSPQQDEAGVEKLRVREDGTARHSRHRTQPEPVSKVRFFVC